MKLRKFSAIFVSAAIVLYMLPTFTSFVSAAIIASQESDFVYTVDSQKNEVTVKNVRDKNVTQAVIPEEIEGKPVVQIDALAFQTCSRLDKVVIPASVTKIGSYAFSNCFSLTEFSVDAENTKFSSIGGVLFDKSGKTLVIFPCGNSGDANWEYNIPEGVEKLANNAFQNSRKIRKITLPASLKEIGSNVFVGCSQLSDISVSAENTNFSVDANGVIFNKDRTEIIMVPQTLSGTYTIPQTVTKIGNSAFFNCGNITEIVIPSSVTQIGNSALSYTGITTITIPQSVTKIGNAAFKSCPNLDNIEIPSGVTVIDQSLFEQCKKLTRVTLPHGITTIGNSAFKSCEKLASIEIPNTVTQIGYSAFESCKELTSLCIPSGVTKIGANTFSGCEKLKSVVLPNGLAEIGKEAFKACGELSSVYYIGTQTQWAGITVGADNTALDGKVVFLTYTPPTDLVYSGTKKTVTVTSSASGIGDITVKYYDAADTLLPDAPIYPGSYTVKIDIAATATHSAVTNAPIGTFSITKATPAPSDFETFTPPAMLEFNGSPKTAAVSSTKIDAGKITVRYFDGNILLTEAPMNVGTYTVKINVAESDNYTAAIDITKPEWAFTVTQATPTEVTGANAKVVRGGTLSMATITPGKIVGIDGISPLAGSIAWVDPTDVIQADGARDAIFTPTDLNYAPLTISVNITTYSAGSGGATSLSRHTVKFDSNGGSAVSEQRVMYSAAATEPTAPTKSGYIFGGWYSDKELTKKYDFSARVINDITLYAKWTAQEGEQQAEDENPPGTAVVPGDGGWKNPFIDVSSGDWFFTAVKYANENGLMSGTTATEFSPNLPLTRGMLVAILWRAECSPQVNYIMPFADVNQSAYYAEAVRWAASENIIKGITETEFAPDKNITREQIVSFVY